MSLPEKAKKAQRTEEHKKMRKLEREVVELKRQLSAKQFLADELQNAIEDYHRSNFEIIRQRARRSSKNKPKKLAAFGDTHGSHIDQAAWNAILNDLEQIQPDIIVHGGDAMECGGFLAEHHTTNYVAETEYTFRDDVIATNQMLDQLQQACPKAQIIMLEGNHDARIEKWCVTTTLKKKIDSQFLLNHLGPEKLLHLKERNIRWVRRSEEYDSKRAAGTIKIGKCWFTHPQHASKHHASQMVNKFGGNVVYFHTHRPDFFPGNAVDRDAGYAAWCPGCVCKLRKYWNHSEPTSHDHGYHLQFIQSNDSFLGINVPIYNGKSYITEAL